MFKNIILIPTYNEKKSLKNILNKIDSKFKVIVVDDCSNDGTYQYLKKKKIEFIKNKTNIGYESTLKKGMIYIKKNYKKCNIVITFDADGEHKVSDLKKLSNFQKKNNYDVIVCNRQKLNRFSEYILSKIFKKKYNVVDPISGFKLYKSKKLFLFCKKISKNFFLVDLLVELIKNNSRIGNLEIICNKVSRKPRVGNWIFANLKILNIIKMIKNQNV